MMRDSAPAGLLTSCDNTAGKVPDWSPKRIASASSSDSTPGVCSNASASAVPKASRLPKCRNRRRYRPRCSIDSAATSGAASSRSSAATPRIRKSAFCLVASVSAGHHGVLRHGEECRLPCQRRSKVGKYWLKSGSFCYPVKPLIKETSGKYNANTTPPTKSPTMTTASCGVKPVAQSKRL